MMNIKFGKVDESGAISYAPSTIVVDGARILGPTEAQYRSQKWLPVVDERPEPKDGGWWQPTDKWRRVDPPAPVREETLKDGKTIKIKGRAPAPYIERIWEWVENPPPGVEAYDAAMEAHLRAERSERGYTAREPDAYLNSANERWAQDARDWVAHRDAVMEYALAVLNAVAAGGEAPTLDEFKAALPRIAWTVQMVTED